MPASAWWETAVTVLPFLIVATLVVSASISPRPGRSTLATPLDRLRPASVVQVMWAKPVAPDESGMSPPLIAVP